MTEANNGKSSKEIDLPPPYTPIANPGEIVGRNDFTPIAIDQTQPLNPRTGIIPIIESTSHGTSGDSSSEEIHASNQILHEAPKNVKDRFYRKVYGLLFAQGLFVLLLSIGFLYIPSVKESIQAIPFYQFYGIWVLFVIIIPVILDLFDKFLREPPMDLVLIAIVTCGSGLLISLLGAYIESEKMLIEIGIILIIFLFLIVYTFQNKFHFTPARTVLYCWILNGLGFGILCIAYPPYDAMWIIIPPTLFTTYALAATHLAVRNPEKGLREREVIYGAVSISMYLANISVYAIRLCLSMIPCCRCCSPLFSQRVLIQNSPCFC